MLLGPLVLALTLAGCGSPGAGQGDVANADDDEASEDSYASERPKRGRVKDKDDVSEQGKEWGGWRWKGNRDNCVYVHENKCYAKKKAACKAAGCDGRACLEKSGAPAKIRCEK